MEGAPQHGSNSFYCLAATTADGCQATSVPQTLVDPASVATSGSRVYVGGPGSIAVFSSGIKGRLKQLTSGTNNQDGCVTDDGSGGDCADGTIPGTVVNMAITRDGKTLYAVTDADSLLVFRKSSTGVLTQLQTLAVPNVSGLVGVAVDAGSKTTSVYVAGSGSNSIGVFRRDPVTGTLSQPGPPGTPQVCINAAGTGGCTAAPALGEIGTLVGVVVYKTNRFAYVAGTGGLASFARNKAFLRLTPLAAPAACTTETGNGGACLAGKGIGGLTDIQTTSTKHEIRLRHDLQLGRGAAPGRLARSRFAPAYARSARAYAGFFSSLFEPAPVEILGVAGERAPVALDRRVVARLQQHLDQRAHRLARPSEVVVEHRVEDAQRLEVGEALDPLC